jgi:AcrR family transcriptional regulator
MLRYVEAMTRQADPEKKPALLQLIVDYLIDKPLSALTFRGLADALDISTFTLVYHFGTRSQLIHDIIGAIADRQRGFELAIAPADVTLASYFEALSATFEVTLVPRNRAMQRLEFEAQMFESVQPGRGAMRAVHEELQTLGRETLVALGVDEKNAAVESRLLIDTFYGIQVGLVVNDDEERAREGFDRALQQHRDRITVLGAH